MRSYLGKHIASERNDEEKAAMRMRAYEDFSVCVIDLNPLNAMDRAYVERIFLDQTDRERREMQVTSNVERLR